MVPRGEYLDTKDRSILSRAKSGTLRRLLNFGQHPHPDFLALTTRFRNTPHLFSRESNGAWPRRFYLDTTLSATSRNILII
jgi:hypothetical protein